MRTFLPIIPTILMLVSSALFSQQTAVTENGQIVILREDGTWQFGSAMGAKLESPHTLIALTRRALERSEPEKAFSYAERALALAEETHGKVLFYYGVSAWNSKDIELALSIFELCSQLKGSRFAEPCRREGEKLEQTTTNGTYDSPFWATDPLRELDLEPD